ncbi:FAD-binding oxidoreductase, partial [Glutamicibacter arilaitensis]
MSDAYNDLVETLRRELPEDSIVLSDSVLRENSRDFGNSPVSRDALAVVFPTEVGHVQAVMRVATANRIPVISRGAGTGVSGGV